MKKASSILLLLSSIFSFISAGTFIISSIMLFIFGPNDALLSEISGLINFDLTTINFFLLAGVFLVVGILYIVFGLLALYAKTNVDKDINKNWLYILTIIFGAFDGSIFMLLGGIFAVVNFSSNEAIQNDSNNIDKNDEE